MINIKTIVNTPRRIIMRILTKGLGSTTTKIKEKPEIKRILICRPNNRLGNQLLLTPLANELIELFPDCTIDLFVRGNSASIIFANYKNVDRIINLPRKPFKEPGKYLNTFFSLRKNTYDLAICVDRNSSSGRMSARLAKSKLKLYNERIDELATKLATDYNHMAKAPVHNLRYFLGKLGYNIHAEKKEIHSLDLKLSENELIVGKKRLHEFTGNNRKTICLYTFATGNKCYPKDWWQRLYSTIKSEHGDTYNIIEILPYENVSQIDFEAPSYYSQDVREMGAFMAHCQLFVTGDCGIMHLASAVGITVAGLFSVSKMDMYAPYNNGSIAIDTNNDSIEKILGKISGILSNKTQ